MTDEKLASHPMCATANGVDPAEKRMIDPVQYEYGRPIFRGKSNASPLQNLGPPGKHGRPVQEKR